MNNHARSNWFQSKFLLITTVLLSISFVSTQAQTLNYEAFMGNDKFGEIKAVREVNDESEIIAVEGFYQLPGEQAMKMEFWSKSVYMNGILKKSEGTIRIDDGQKFTTTTFLHDKEYIVEREVGTASTTLAVSQLYGTDLLYFEPPGLINKIYDMYFGEEMKFVRINDQEYYLVSNEKKYPYHYEDGILKSYSNPFGELAITLKLVE